MIDCLSRILSGCVIVIDYGDVEGELFASHRHQGTLMCYRKHEAHDNPFIDQGEQGHNRSCQF